MTKLRECPAAHRVLPPHWAVKGAFQGQGLGRNCQHLGTDRMVQKSLPGQTKNLFWSGRMLWEMCWIFLTLQVFIQESVKLFLPTLVFLIPGFEAPGSQSWCHVPPCGGRGVQDAVPEVTHPDVTPSLPEFSRCAPFPGLCPGLGRANTEPEDGCWMASAVVQGTVLSRVLLLSAVKRALSPLKEEG